MAATATREVKIVEVTLPKDFAFFALQALVGLDAAYHILDGMGVLFNVGGELVSLSGVINPIALAWGILMFLGLMLFLRKVKTK